ncbi:MAG: hypothetical protein QM773_21085 [Hyphomonadaceae bacterium]
MTTSTERALAYLAANATAKKLNQKYHAALAVLAYDFTLLASTPGLKFLQRAPQKFGYDAAVYFHAASGVLAFVNRGTDGLRSMKDWIESSAAALTARFDGPLKASVLFAIDTIKKISSAKGLAGVKIDAVTEVNCTGHSWGGALSEAQVALTQAIGAKNGLAISQAFYGTGFASAGFADAIRAYAAAEGVQIEDDMHWLVNHFIRGADAILLQPNHKLLGEFYAIPGIYLSGQVPSANGRGFEYGLNAPILTNHDAGLYFDQFELRGPKHLFQKRNGSFLLCDGIVPRKTRFGTNQPETQIMGTVYP